MIPLDHCTRQFQSVCEAEYDVVVLLQAMRLSPTPQRFVVKKYVIVAELAFLDELKGMWEVLRKRLSAEEFRNLKAKKKDFDRELSLIEGSLHRSVRNRSAAHKELLSVESEREMMAIINSDSAGRVFRLARGVLDHLAGLPIWVWAWPADTAGGVFAVHGTCWRPALQEEVLWDDGFDCRLAEERLTPCDVSDRQRFSSLAEAKTWAEQLDFTTLPPAGTLPSRMASL